MVGPGHASCSALESRNLNFKLSCKTIYQYLSYKTNSEQPLQWLVGYSPDKFQWFWARPRASLRVQHFETLLYNFTCLSTISPNFRTTRSVVTENSSGQIEVERKGSEKIKGRRRIIRKDEAKNGELRLGGNYTVTEYEMCEEPYSQNSGWIKH